MNELILDLPFDESNGSIAFDYSDNQTNAILHNRATRVAGHSGNGLRPKAEGYAKTRGTNLDIQGDFTTTMWVKPNTESDYANVQGYRLQYGIAPSTIVNIDYPVVDSNNWTHFAIVKEGVNIKWYVNGLKVIEQTLPAQPAEFMLRTVDEPTTGFDYTLDMTFSSRRGAPFFNGIMDEVRIYEGALNASDILNDLNGGANKRVLYKVDGQPFEDYGVYVSESTGVIDALDIKEPTSTDWAYENGQNLDLDRPRYQMRTIELECFIKASSSVDFAVKMNNFIRKFQSEGLHRLYIGISDRTPLVYEVYAPSVFEVEKKWRPYEMIGTFTLSLVETRPRKRVIRFVPKAGNATARLNISSPEAINIYWGDLHKTVDILAEQPTLVEHTYATEYQGKPVEIIIQGQDIVVSSNGIEIWEML